MTALLRELPALIGWASVVGPAVYLLLATGGM
jgi:hypothetical protein